MKIRNLYLYSTLILNIIINSNFNTSFGMTENDIEETSREKKSTLVTIEDIKKDFHSNKMDEAFISNLANGPKEYLFSTKDATGHQWMAKVEGGIENVKPRMQEFLSHEIARIAKIDDVVVPMQLIGNNKILLSKYAYFLPQKGQYTQVEDALKSAYADKDLSKITAKIGSEGEDGINIEKISGKLNWDEKDSYTNIDPVSYQKSLIFLFLTFQQDANYSNILYTLIGDSINPLLKPINFDFVFSMTEENVGKILPNNPYLYQEAHHRGIEFSISQNQPVEAEVLKIVQNLSYEKFDQILNEYQLDEQDQLTFKSRINDIQKAFSDVSSLNIGEIMEPLFKKHEENILREKENS